MVLILGEVVCKGGVQLCYVSLCVGDIVGEYLVQFIGLGECIEFIYCVINCDIFVCGVLFVVIQLNGCVFGSYWVCDLFDGFLLGLVG